MKAVFVYGLTPELATKEKVEQYDETVELFEQRGGKVLDLDKCNHPV